MNAKTSTAAAGPIRRPLPGSTASVTWSAPPSSNRIARSNRALG
ncbi:MAG TPA: hypothetical protein VGP28_05610 [Methylocella sp.]|nr:hypothetical protein [Methylocella sp.]